MSGVATRTLSWAGRWRWTARGVVAAALLAAGTFAQAPQLPSFGQPSDRPPNEDFYLYRPLPDIRLHTLQGETTLGTLWRQKPLLLTMIFTRCARVCAPLVGSLAQAERHVGGAGREYFLVVLSFDPRDSLEDLRAAAAALGLEGRPGWIFATASPGEIASLAAAVGFWYRWDAASLQYDHPAVLVGIDRGRLVRLLVAPRVEASRLREVVAELQGRFIASYSYPLPGSHVVFRCFSYDPSGAVHFSWGALLLVLPGTVALAAALLVFHRPRGRRKPLPVPTPAPAWPAAQRQQ